MTTISQQLNKSLCSILRITHCELNFVICHLPLLKYIFFLHKTFTKTERKYILKLSFNIFHKRNDITMLPIKLVTFASGVHNNFLFSIVRSETEKKGGAKNNSPLV